MFEFFAARGLNCFLSHPCCVVVLSADALWLAVLVLSFILLCCGTHSEAPLSPDHYGNSQVSQSPLPEAHRQWAYDSESGSDSDPDRPDPDLVLDDLASRRFHSPTPTTPTNFAVPLSPLALGSMSRVRCGSWSKVNMAASVPSAQSVTVLRSENMKRQCGLFFAVPALMRANLNASLTLSLPGLLSPSATPFGFGRCL